VPETADLKSLARRVLERDNDRDTMRDRASRRCLAASTQARQFPPSVSEPGRLVSASYGRTLAALQERCPEMMEEHCWHRAIEDGHRFIARWGKQATALGWTARDLFGLHQIPDKPPPNYRRLSRYDQSGLIWLLQGRPVVALTESTAAIENPTGAITVYRKNSKPALGPTGDSLDDF